MIFSFTIETEVEKTGGKYVGKEEIAEALKEALDDADPVTLYIEQSQYETTSWDVKPS